MAGKLNIAVIGAGLIGAKHVEIVAKQDCLSAIVEPGDDGANIARNQGARHYHDLDTLLAESKIDGAIIATPNQLHFEHAKTCIDHGIPCLVEKPLTDCVDSAAKLAALSKQANIPVLVGHHRRHNPLIAQAKEVIERGDLGRIVFANALFCLYKPDDYYAPEWRRKAGAGPIYINLIHDLDLLRYLCGEIEDVQAVQSNAVRGFEVEDTAAVILKFSNGALGTIGISDTVVAPWSWEFTAAENPVYPHVQTHSYTISGTEGSLSIPDLTLWTQKERSWWKPIDSKQLQREAAESLERQFAHFCRVIRGEESPLVTAEEGYKNQLVLDLITKSAGENSPLSARGRVQ